MILLLNIARGLMVLWCLRPATNDCAQRRSQATQPDKRRDPSHRSIRHRLLARSNAVCRVATQGCFAREPDIDVVDRPVVAVAAPPTCLAFL
jgi:hypothetical protein